MLAIARSCARPYDFTMKTFVDLRKAVLLATLAMAPLTPAADQRDTPALTSFARGGVDIGDLYVFRSPSNANNTVFIMTLGSFVGAKTRAAFKPGVHYEFRVDTNFDFSTDLIISVRFKEPRAGGKQALRVTRSQGFDTTFEIATGDTNTTIPLEGGGQFKAGVFDDPFFFDQSGFDSTFIKGEPGFPRAPGTAKNFYGPNANVLAIAMEIPSNSIAPGSTVVGVWARTVQRGLQLDRCGRPFTNVMLIPPVPRTDHSLGDRRKAFNRGLPADDVEEFADDIKSVIANPDGPYHRTEVDATTLADLFLPDLLFFQLGNPNGFGTFISSPGGTVLGNGRRLSDDVTDTILTVLTNTQITTDNVGDDNGLKVTDGSVDPVSGQTRAIAFPYIGNANDPPGGPNP
jgi:Domain of unknown function (DUF4331)